MLIAVLVCFLMVRLALMVCGMIAYMWTPATEAAVDSLSPDYSVLRFVLSFFVGLPYISTTFTVFLLSLVKRCKWFNRPSQKSANKEIQRTDDPLRVSPAADF